MTRLAASRARRERAGGVRRPSPCYDLAVLRRLVLIGDVHTEATRLTHVLAYAERVRPDAILCVGDIVDGPEDATRCIELLRDHGVATVRGNHERWLLGGTPFEPYDPPPWALAWLRALPPTRQFETVAGRLLLGHGIGNHDMVNLRPDDHGYALAANLPLWQLVLDRACDLYVGGHTHRCMIRRFEDVLVLNPGTLARRDSPGFVDVDLDAGSVHCFHVSLDGITADRSVSLAQIPREPAPRL